MLVLLRGFVYVQLKHLLPFTAIAKHGNAFETPLPRLSIDTGNVVCSGVAGQVDRLRHRIVHVFLKSRLDTQVIFWSYVQRGLEEAPAGLGNLAQTRQRALAVQRPDEVCGIKT